MQISETITLAEHWLAMPYKALRHGADIASMLYRIMSTSNDSTARHEASRLYQRVQSVMSQIRAACPFVPKDCYRVAFLPVATYDDETGMSILPTDYIQYPADCTLAQRLQLQYAEAEKTLSAAQGGSSPSKGSEDATEPECASAPTVSSVPTPSLSSDASLDDVPTSPKPRRRRRQSAE